MKKYRYLIGTGVLLAALAPILTHAAANTWTGAGSSYWDTTTANWTSPTTWVQGSDAIFDVTGAGQVNLGEAIYCPNMTFNASYTLVGGGLPLNNESATGQSVITAAAGTSNLLQLSIWGTNSMTFTGTGTTVLEGDLLQVDANHFTGGTYIRRGTVILQATYAGTANTSPYAVDSVQALDTNATLVIPGIWNGSTYGADRDQLAVNGQLAPAFCQLNMTGGTLDLQNDTKSQRIPIPSGSGVILNSGASVQAGVQILNDGYDHTFSGVIEDGNNGVLNGDNVHPVAPSTSAQGPGYQIGIVTFSGSQPGKVSDPRGYNIWTLSGPNTYSGSTRIDQGAAIKLEGAGQIGAPMAAGGMTGPMRIYGPGGLELNGHNQTIACMTDGNSSGWISNSAPNSVSTYTFGYGNEAVYNRACSYKFGDNPSTGAILALKKVSTGLPYIVPNSWVSSPTEPTAFYATNSWQTLKSTATCTYSGDTTVSGGVLVLQGPSAVSPYSAYRLQSTPSPGCISSSCSLLLSYSGTANVRQLWIDGVQQPNGVYGSIGNSLGAIGVAGIDPASTGTLTVTGYAPVVLGAAKSGNTVTFSWAGVYKLQSKTNSLNGQWFDYPGGVTSPVNVQVDPSNTSVFYRLATLP
jgi:autotransporter-associated beta strand protein